MSFIQMISSSCGSTGNIWSFEPDLYSCSIAAHDVKTRWLLMYQGLLARVSVALILDGSGAGNVNICNHFNRSFYSLFCKIKLDLGADYLNVGRAHTTAHALPLFLMMCKNTKVFPKIVLCFLVFGGFSPLLKPNEIVPPTP